MLGPNLEELEIALDTEIGGVTENREGEEVLMDFISKRMGSYEATPPHKLIEHLELFAREINFSGRFLAFLDMFENERERGSGRFGTVSGVFGGYV
ncbi:hypothetical protein K435DRAFT_786691 [Dendrothele bispora CBS 962.96]|uniref:Uncharacterized protein n=1 Tax=Dendrothele bispora (strain CBS 962.96) TaxID=1314807 RepID=A0A4S8KPM7_DENBC|nr:hypothetical protein K435DRAFT_786691 [Dendrothele bispora CBS 962.96]